MKKVKRFKYKILVPSTSNWSWIQRADDNRSISIYDLPIAQLRKLGRAFTNNLIERRNKGIRGKMIKSV